MDILDTLFSMQDETYKDFQAKLTPELPAERFIGVRTPQLRGLAKELVKSGEYEVFIRQFPHSYFDENQLHAFIISELKDYEKAIAETERFLPFVDNWATCDQLRPKSFAKNKDKLILRVREWLKSDRTYTVRFAVGMLMCHWLDDDFDPEYPDLAANIESGEYYINVMRAWYFATALAKQYDSAVKYLEECRLDPWTHNKTIQKARESLRVSDERKAYLNTLRIK